MSLLFGRWKKKTVRVLVRTEVHCRKVVEIPEDVWVRGQVAHETQAETPEGDAARDALSDAISEELPDFEGWDDFHILREDYELAPEEEEGETG